MIKNVIENNAQTIYIETDNASYGIFCFNDSGDLFLNSDYGMYGYAWRHTGTKTFKEFLSTCNEDYILGKFQINYNSTNSKKMNKFYEEKLLILIKEFINLLQSN